jgi:predicted acyl esterase
VTLCGAGEVVLVAASDAPSFDVAVALSVVGPEGRAVQVASGHARLDGAPGVVRVALRATCCTVAAGQAVRLSVAGAAFPGFAVNPGTGVAAPEFTAEAERTVTIGIVTGGGSWLELPVLPA